MRNSPARPPGRPRRWPLFLPFAIVILLAIGWTAFWFYAARRADAEIAAWRAREWQAGRQQDCASHHIGGFPFRIEVLCDGASLVVDGQPTLKLKLSSILAAIQAYAPNLMIAEFTGPLEISEPENPPTAVVSWTLGQASVRGLLRGALQRASLVLDQPLVRGAQREGDPTLFRGQRLELHVRPAQSDLPAIEAVLRLQGAAVERVHPLAAIPTNADIAAVVHGLDDVSPKPWPVLLSAWQARGGWIQILHARIEQADVIVSAAGRLALTARGGLDGSIELTVVGLEKLLKALDVEDRIGATLGALNRVMPGLGAIAGSNPGAGLVAALGQRTSLEGKPATAIEVRFAEGAVLVGPFQVAQLAPLF